VIQHTVLFSYAIKWCW